jgi:hypothetical protein
VIQIATLRQSLTAEYMAGKELQNAPGFLRFQKLKSYLLIVILEMAFTVLKTVPETHPPFDGGRCESSG